MTHQNDMDRRKFLKLTGGGLGAAAFLAACGDDEEPAPAPTTTAAAATTTTAAPATTEAAAPELSGSLRWAAMTLPGLPYLDEVQPTIDSFTALHPGVSIELEEIPPDGYTEKLVAYKAVNNMPDLFFSHNGWVDLFAQQGVTLDMRPYLEVDPDLNVDAWYPSMLQVCSTVALGDQAAGEMHCQGMSADVSTFFYNIPMLEAAGLELPGDGFTWDDMAEYARVLTTGDVIGYAPAPDNPDNAHGPIGAFGGDYLDEEAQVMLIDDNFKAGLRALWDPVIEGVFATPEQVTAAGGPHDGFIGGRFAMVRGAVWSVPALRAAEFEWDVHTLPEGTHGSRAGGGTAGWGVSAQTEHPDIVWELIKHIYGPAYVPWMEGGAVVPPLKRYADDPRWRQPPPNNHQAFIDAAGTIIISPIGGPFDSAGGIHYAEFAGAFRRYVIEGQSMDDALAPYEANMNAALAESPAVRRDIPIEVPG